MKLIVGLGNPGEKYKNTRHNVGFMVLDALTLKVDRGPWTVDRKFNCSLLTVNGSLLFAKPQTFMNDSGIAVAKLAEFYKIKPQDIYIIHDDLDIKLGEYKIQKGVGPKVHNGVNSIEEKLGTKDFWRIRVGVDNRNPENRVNGEDYVLQKFEEEENQLLKKVIDEVTEELLNNASRN